MPFFFISLPCFTLVKQIRLSIGKLFFKFYIGENAQANITKMLLKIIHGIWLKNTTRRKIKGINFAVDNKRAFFQSDWKIFTNYANKYYGKYSYLKFALTLKIYAATRCLFTINVLIIFSIAIKFFHYFRFVIII